MVDLSTRSYKKELLDADNIPFADIQQNMQELNTINSLLGGHAITIAGVKALLQQHPPGQPITICEIGCGGGDNLLAIDRWCRKNGYSATFIGIDLQEACIGYAQQQCASIRARWIVSDYQQVSLLADKPSIIFSSLFCHHFDEKALAKMMQWMQANCTSGFFINDLQRNTLAYYSIKLLTSIFSKSYLVKNDAPLSVARGFRKKEWSDIFQSAGLQSYSIQWRWAFRYLIIYKHE